MKWRMDLTRRRRMMPRRMVRLSELSSGTVIHASKRVEMRVRWARVILPGKSDRQRRNLSTCHESVAASIGAVSHKKAHRAIRRSGPFHKADWDRRTLNRNAGATVKSAQRGFQNA